MKKQILIFIILLLSSIIFAIEFSSEVNRTKLGISEQLIYTVKIRAGDEISGAQLIRPDFKGFSLIQQSGPSTMSSISIINGKMTRSYEQTYTFVLLANSVGEFTIAPAYLIVGNQKFQSAPQKITVTKEAVKLQDSFIKTEISKSNCYVDEMIIYSIKLYYRKSFDNAEMLKTPDFSGFVKENLINNNNERNQHIEEYNGVKYNVIDVARFALFPIKSGTYTLEAPVIRTIAGQDPFSGGFGFFSQPIVNTLRAENSTVIKVSALPEENQPDNFSGSIGNIKIKAEVKNYKKEVRTGESIICIVKLFGEGNVKGIKMPSIKNSDWINVYEPSVKEDKKIVNNQITFEKEFKYIIVPSKKGEYKLGPFEYSYFNPNTKKYETARSQSFEFLVKPGDRETIQQQFIATQSGSSAASVGIIAGQESAQDGVILKESLRYIKESKSSIKNHDYIITSKKFIIIESLAVLIFIISIAIKFLSILRQKTYISLKSRKAFKTANKILKKARTHLRKKEYDKFAQEISKAIFKYIGDKFNLSDIGLTTEKINELLSDRNVPTDLINKIKLLCENCDMIRFSPSAFPESKFEEINKDAENTIVEVEKSIKR